MSSCDLLSPLIREARERQRRRRLALAQVAAFAAVLAFVLAAWSRGGGDSGRLGMTAGSDAAATVQADVRAVVASFDGALAVGDFRRACGLLDPLMGMATVRSATDEIGATGGCRQRLALFARSSGPSSCRS